MRIPDYDTLCATGATCAMLLGFSAHLGEVKLALLLSSAGIAVTALAMIKMGREVRGYHDQ